MFEDLPGHIREVGKRSPASDRARWGLYRLTRLRGAWMLEERYLSVAALRGIHSMISVDEETRELASRFPECTVA
ncbi:hypothetical protein [Nocardia niwae]|uniref:hypothetical protein n=1 Tax=Nocardia niwae TaxID=626084 RepID=UPI0012F52A77|nr:hypothetical protein [Nocardia niwae]